MGHFSLPLFSRVFPCPGSGRGPQHLPGPGRGARLPSSLLPCVAWERGGQVFQICWPLCWNPDTGNQKAPPRMMGFSCSVCSPWPVFWRAPLPSQPPSTCPLLQATLSLSQANGPVKECLLDLPLFFTASQGAVCVSFAPMPRHTSSEPCLRAFTHLATH